MIYPRWIPTLSVFFILSFTSHNATSSDHDDSSSLLELSKNASSSHRGLSISHDHTKPLSTDPHDYAHRFKSLRLEEDNDDAAMNTKKHGFLHKLKNALNFFGDFGTTISGLFHAHPATGLIFDGVVASAEIAEVGVNAGEIGLKKLAQHKKKKEIEQNYSDDDESL